MNDRQNPSSEDGQDQLPKDPQDRAEIEWLLAREQNPDAPPPNAVLARDHTELSELLDTLPVGKPDRSWHADVLRLIDEEERGAGDIAATSSETTSGIDPSSASAQAVVEMPAAPVVARLPLWRRSAVRVSAVGGALLAAAAALMLFLKLPATKESSQDGGNLATADASPDAAAPALQLLIDERVASRGEDGDGVIPVNQIATITLPTPIEGAGEIRVFFRGKGGGGGKLAYMCGDAAGACQLKFENELQLKIKVASVGDYVAVALRGQSDLPLDATYDQFRRSSKQGKALSLNFSAR